MFVFTFPLIVLTLLTKEAYIVEVDYPMAVLMSTQFTSLTEYNWVIVCQVSKEANLTCELSFFDYVIWT